MPNTPVFSYLYFLQARFGATKQSTEPDVLSSALKSSRRGTSDGPPSLLVGSTKSQQKLVGTSTALEKEYLRLTTFPKPENVRPLNILIKALSHVKSRFIKTEDFEWGSGFSVFYEGDLPIKPVDQGQPNPGTFSGEYENVVLYWFTIFGSWR